MSAKIIHAEVKEDYLVHVRFDDGLEGDLDFSDYVGKGVFERWRDYENFRKVEIEEFGGLIWEGELDFCPDALHMRLSGQSPDEHLSLKAAGHA